MKRIIIITIAITIIAIVGSYIQRGYFAFGGEWFIPILPTIYLLERENKINV